MSYSLRVAFLNPNLWVGGGTVFTLNLGAGLLKHNVPTEVFSLSSIHSLERDFIHAGLRVSRLQGEGMIFEDRAEVIVEAMRDFSPTAVIASVGFDSCEVLRYVPAGIVRIGVIHAAHQGVFECADAYRPWLDHLVAVSSAFEVSLKASVKKFSPERISSIELGVPVPENARKSASVDRPLRILYLGRLEEAAKRVRLFPEIFRGLCAADIPFQWTIAGIGPEQQFLQREMVSPSPHQQIHFAGLVPYSELPALFREHDVILLTSDSETFSLSLHEGMAAGLVPVASALPGRVGEIITPQTGRPVPPEQIDGYAQSIVWLHEHRAELETMSRASREMISARYSIAAMTDRWMSFLKPLVPERTPVWPDRWNIQPPIGQENAIRYRRWVRPLRSVVARLRARFRSRGCHANVCTL